MKPVSITILIALVATAFASNDSRALTLAEFYSLDHTAKVWYLGGVYDANVIQSGKGARGNCIESLGLAGFTQKMSEFVGKLPADVNAKERKVFDSMNVALLSVLVIDKACKR